MFEADQFPQFTASTAPTSPSLHGSSSSSPLPNFDLYTTSHPHLSFPPNFLHPKIQEKHQNTMNLDRSILDSMDPWSTEEVLTLLRIRSSLENWFPQFTWDHVSRKLAEFGFKRSAEKCKEKFEEESKYFNNINFLKNYRFGELEDLYNNNINQEIIAEKNKKLEDKIEQQDSRIDQTVAVEEKLKANKKRKRKKKFEMFKGFCEDIVSKIMAQQEQMHNKLLEDMVKRDEEKVAREEAWKKQEMDRIDKELQIRAQEQALAGDRQATIINFLKKFSSPSIGDKNPNSEPSTSTTIVALDHQDSSFLSPTQNPNSSPQNPNNIRNSQSSVSADQTVQNKQIAANDKDDVGKRWPKDEVLALINLRCSLYNSNEDKESETAKAPLWERISKGMLDLGYKRSAKRCKEKWENINKYFRKTKDVNKKRSLDSRTCPYFHQLSTLYSQGKLVASSEGRSPENCRNNGSSNSTMQVAEGEKNLVQASGFEFEF